MTHRRPEPYQRDVEDFLRRALYAAAESVEPAVDGLDRIRFRIAARRDTPTGRRVTAMAGPRDPLLLRLQDARLRLRFALNEVIDGFRPAQDRHGWYRWLRPAAGLATATFVVAAGFWALTALPQVISTSANSGPGPGQITTGLPNPLRSSGPASQPYHTPSPSHRPHPSGSRGCVPTKAATRSPSSSPSATATSTPTPTTSPSGSPTGTPSPTGSPTGTPSPTSSATGSTPGASPVLTGGPTASQRAGPATGSHRSGTTTGPSRKPTPSPTPC